MPELWLQLSLSPAKTGGTTRRTLFDVTTIEPFSHDASQQNFTDLPVLIAVARANCRAIISSFTYAYAWFLLIISCQEGIATSDIIATTVITMSNSIRENALVWVLLFNILPLSIKNSFGKIPGFSPCLLTTINNANTVKQKAQINYF